MRSMQDLESPIKWVGSDINLRRPWSDEIGSNRRPSLFSTSFAHHWVDLQYGFHQGYSTISQLLAFTHKIYSGFDQVPSRKTKAIFLYLLKAFDRIWHAGLLYKLESNCIFHDPLKVISGFLSQRQQRVILKGQSSEWREVSAAIPRAQC